MKKNFIKLIISAFLFISGTVLFAENAQITYVKGKVEVLRGEQWVQLVMGDDVYPSEMISTGFQSEAKIKYNGSLLSLGPVTRITIDQLSKEPGKETVNINLTTGAARSKVTHTDDTRVSYTVRTPAAVASVRGTDFMITSAGKVTCFEGAVVVFSVKQDTKKKTEQKKVEAEKEESEEESTSESESAPGDYPSAGPTTEATEIYEDSPEGAVVVGANQSTQINSSGNPDKPMDVAEKESRRAQTYGETASAKEGESTGSSGSTNTTDSNKDKTPAEIQKGSISVSVTFAE